MATTSSSRRRSGPVLRSLSPSGRFHTAHTTSYFSSPSSSFASSTSSSFSSPSSTFFNPNDNHHHNHHRSASPTRVNLYNSLSLTTPSFSFSLDRSISPNRSVSVSKRNNAISFQKKSCSCSPTTHPGSFRCSLHKKSSVGNHGQGTASYPPNRLNMRRSAMTNSLVRIGGVEGELMKRSLRDLIRPSSHHQKRREGFQTRPSRLSIMSKS